MADCYDAAKSYRDSILSDADALSGDSLPDGETLAWQGVASRLAFSLRQYAKFLDDCAEGRVRGPICFPSWREE